MVRRIRALFIGVCLLGAPPVLAAAGYAGVGGRSGSSSPLVREILAASGVEDSVALDSYEAAFRALVVRVERRVGSRGSEYRRARRMHRALQKLALRRYDLRADGFSSLLDRGVYNCVSSTLLYGAVAAELGFEARVVETPRHVFLRMDLDGRTVDVETTSPQGFDLQRDLTLFHRFLLAYKLATPEEIARHGLDALFDEFHGMAEPVDLDTAVSFLWHNSGERYLEAGKPLRAAQCFRRRYELHPGPARQSEALAAALSRAFRLAYDTAHFEDAYAIALIDLEIHPGRTTVEDRVLAAALKRIERACARGDALEAVAVLEHAERNVEDPVGRTRLVLEAAPEIVAVAVRSERWDLAHEVAARYAAVDPDPVEAGRLLVWVEHRRAGIWSSEPVSGAPRAWSRRLFPLAPPATLASGAPWAGPGPLWGSPIGARVLFSPQDRGADDRIVEPAER